ncbi:hypothetical protein QYF61_016456 [Mycteria americana]|uniref:RIMB1/RIM3A-C-like N-terminal domain-containing protein n=1 Tax=Mycteria americana TaxID=33587 RepID=A0AAN7RPT3_MYCAM|nr:hypothetical protein QYF61_016456 [Mycteria americana]
MTRGVAGQGPVPCSHPSPRRRPAQGPGSLAQKEKQRRELEALRAELEEERLRTQELRRCFAAKTRELKAALEREQQLLADRLQSQWEQQHALEVRRLQELNQRQREAETCQLLRWKEAELREGQELLRRECTAAVRQARDLQQQLAEEMVRPTRSGREAQSKLQDVLSRLPWETDGYQPACIRHLQNQLQLERRLFTKYILQVFKGELPASPGMAQPKGLSELQGHQEMQSSCSSGRKGPQALVALQERLPDSHSTGQQTTCKAVAGAQLQMPEREDVVLLGSKRSQLLEQNTRLKRVLQALERQQSALERESHLLEQAGSPEACKEAERLQQKITKLAALASQLGERSRQLQETINCLINTHID